MKHYKMILLSLFVLIFLTGCENGMEEVIDELKYELSIEYDVPVSDIEIDVIEYGISVFSTNQLKVTIESEDIYLYFIEKGNSRDSFKRIPIK